jgi:general stress protein 26
MEQLGSHSTNFDEISVFRKSVEKIEVSLKSDKNDGSFTSRIMYNYNNIYFISSQNKEFSDKSCRENQNIQFIFQNLYPKIVPFMR